MSKAKKTYPPLALCVTGEGNAASVRPNKLDLLPWLHRHSDESHFEYEQRAEKTRARIASTGVPTDYYYDAHQEINGDKQFHKLNRIFAVLENPSNEKFIKYSLLMGDMGDKEICRIADALAGNLTRNNPAAPLSKQQSRRRLRTLKRQSIEQLAHVFGLIGKGKKYLRTTTYNKRERAEQNFRNQDSINKMTVKTPKGEFKISDLRDQTVRARVAELYCTLKGMEQIAMEQGMSWAMITFTASPSHHPTAATYAGGSMVEAAREIHGKIRSVFKELNYRKIFVSGARAAEFHKDGCPHDHALIFYRKHDEAGIQESISKHFTLTFSRDAHGEEGLPTANWMRGDSTKSRPSSYGMGYVLKATIAQANGIQTDEMRDLDTLYSTWCMRRFALFGVPSRTTWRAAREIEQEQIPSGFPMLTKIAALAKKNDAQGFIAALGGLGIKNGQRPARFSKINRDTHWETVGRESEIIAGEKLWSSFSLSKEKCAIFRGQGWDKDGNLIKKTQIIKKAKVSQPNEYLVSALKNNYSSKTQSQATAAPIPAKKIDAEEQKQIFFDTLDSLIFISTGNFTDIDWLTSLRERRAGGNH